MYKFLLPFLLLPVFCSAQWDENPQWDENKADSPKQIIPEKAEIGCYLGGGYELLNEGEESMSYSPAGGSHYDLNSSSSGYSALVGARFKLPLSKKIFLNIDGTYAYMYHHFVYSSGSSFSALNYSSSSYRESDYITHSNNLRMSIMPEFLLGTKRQFYVGFGVFLFSKEKIWSTNGQETVDTSLTYTRYNEDIKRGKYNFEVGGSLSVGYRIPLKKNRYFFFEAMALCPFRDSINDPNIKIYHLTLNAGLLFTLKK
jgi:hypothetical protein